MDPYSVFSDNDISKSIYTNERYKKQDAILAKENFETIIFGNSRYGVIDPANFNNAYNASYFSADVSDVKETIECIDKYNKLPKNVLLFIDPFMLSTGFKQEKISYKYHPKCTDELKAKFYLSYLFLPTSKLFLAPPEAKNLLFNFKTGMNTYTTRFKNYDDVVKTTQERLAKHLVDDLFYVNDFLSDKGVNLLIASIPINNQFEYHFSKINNEYRNILNSNKLDVLGDFSFVEVNEKDSYDEMHQTPSFFKDYIEEIQRKAF
ncbi:hypothetical protein A3715_15620 [Oleiphilus sp. HI0009]|nr:hypothetical protein A3715_15620 [Oleiphilus sp. HI0009]